MRTGGDGIQTTHLTIRMSSCICTASLEPLLGGKLQKLCKHMKKYKRNSQDPMQLREVSFAELNFEILQHVLKKKKKNFIQTWNGRENKSETIKLLP